MLLKVSLRNENNKKKNAIQLFGTFHYLSKSLDTFVQT